MFPRFHGELFRLSPQLTAQVSSASRFSDRRAAPTRPADFRLRGGWQQNSQLLLDEQTGLREADRQQEREAAGSCAARRDSSPICAIPELIWSTGPELNRRILVLQLRYNILFQ